MKVLVSLIAVAAIGAAIGCGGDSNDEEAGSGGTQQICELTANGLELLASEVHEGESMGAAIKILGPGVCVYLAEAAFSDPSEDVIANIELPDGESTHFSGTAEELIAPLQEKPEPSADIDIERLIACAKAYSVQFLFDECADGYIEP